MMALDLSKAEYIASLSKHCESCKWKQIDRDLLLPFQYFVFYFFIFFLIGIEA